MTLLDPLANACELRIFIVYTRDTSGPWNLINFASTHLLKRQESSGQQTASLDLCSGKDRWWDEVTERYLRCMAVSILPPINNLSKSIARKRKYLSSALRSTEGCH